LPEAVKYARLESAEAIEIAEGFTTEIAELAEKTLRFSVIAVDDISGQRAAHDVDTVAAWHRQASRRLGMATGTGSWKLEAGNWKLATGNWQLATGNWQLDPT
jgi:hypothetical protein